MEGELHNHEQPENKPEFGLEQEKEYREILEQGRQESRRYKELLAEMREKKRRLVKEWDTLFRPAEEIEKDFFELDGQEIKVRTEQQAAEDATKKELKKYAAEHGA